MTPPAATAAGRALPHARTAPRAPRRVSGPAPRSRASSTGARAAPRRGADPFALRALRRGRLLADSRLLDRLVRGRLWIPLVAAGLMGIVFMQVSMLKLNAGIGRAVQSADTLERQNATLRTDVSRMESGDSIDAVAHELGMVVPQDGGEVYVSARGRELAARAAQRMTSPDPNALARAQAATQAAAAATGAAATTTGTVAAAGAATTATTQQQAAAPPTGTAAGAPTTATTPPAQTQQQAPPQTAQAPQTTQQAATPPTQQSQTAAGATAAPPAAAAASAPSAGGAAAPTDGTA
jgi:hypothetical protein